MVINKEIEFKKVKFTEDKIIIKKRKGNIVLPLNNIDKIQYAVFTLRNYFSLGFGDWRSPGFLYIYLIEPINKKTKYCIFIKYNDLILIPEKVYKKIELYVPGEPW